MCGIAGRIGHDLVELMDARVHRGTDSTGFALYGPPPLEAGFAVRAVGFDRSTFGRDLDDRISIVRDFGSDIVDDPTHGDARSRHVSVRIVAGSRRRNLRPD